MWSIICEILKIQLPSIIMAAIDIQAGKLQPLLA